MRVVTPKCFCWGLQKDRLNTQKVTYKLSLVMSSVTREQTGEHKEFVSLFEKVVKICQEHCKGALGKTKGVEGLGSCLHSKGDKGPFTLYAKVRFKEAKKKFFTRFQKMRVRQGESKVIDPLSVEGYFLR